MKKFNVTTSSGRKFSIEGDTLTLDKVLLLVANQYGEEWYGCCVSEEGTKNFYANAVKEYFTDGDPNKSVYEWAIQSYCSSIRFEDPALHKEVYNPYEDEQQYITSYNPFKEIGAKNEN